MSFNRIYHKRTQQSGTLPPLSSLNLSEIAVSLFDGKLFLKQTPVPGNSSYDKIVTFLNKDDNPYTLNSSFSSINTTLGNNTVYQVYGSVLGGADNINYGAAATIVNGDTNKIYSDFAYIGTGYNNSIYLSGVYSSILNGENNTIALSGDHSAILGGSNNRIDHANTFILGSNIKSHSSDFTYTNNLSVVGVIYGNGKGLTNVTGVDTQLRELSSGWQSTYTQVQTNSAQWALSQDTEVRALTSIWQNTYTQVQTNSAQWALSQDTEVRALTSDWQNTFTTVYTNSGQWASNEDTGVRALTSNWESTFTTVQSNSAQWASNEDTGVRSLTSIWQNTYTQVQTNSGQWASNVDTEVRALTSIWQNTYTQVQTNSGQWASNEDTGVRALTSDWQNTFTTVYTNSGQWASNVDTGLRSLTSNWDYTYTTVYTNSGQWASNVDTGVRALTSDWQNTFTTVYAGSALWASNEDTGVRALTGIWQNTYTQVQTNSGQWASNEDTGVRALTADWQSTFTYISGNSANIVLTTDPRLSNSRTPTGSAGGDLDGNYPAPSIKNSVALFGQPTAPTAAVGTNTTQIATTEFVQNNRGDKYLTTSSSSNDVDNVSPKTFIVSSSALSYTPTQDVTIVYDVNNHMHGSVISYTGNTLIVDISQHTGTGTYTNWVINVGGLSNQAGVLLQANNLNDVANAATALTNLGGVSSGRAIYTGNGLTGGGDLTTDRTISIVFGNTSNTAVSGNDPRLTDSRVPTNHKTSHAIGGSDPLTPSDIGAIDITTYQYASGDWQNTFTSYASTSASFYQTLNYNDNNKELSISNGNTVSLSALNVNVDSGIRALTGNWQSTYTLVSASSANWASNASIQYIHTNFLNLTGGELYGTLIGNVSSTGSFFGDGSKLTGIVAGDTDATSFVRTNSAKWESTYTTVYSESASWVGGGGGGTGGGSDVSGLSGNWQSTYTTFSATSASFYQTLYFNESSKLLSISNGNTVSLSAFSTGAGGDGVDTGVRALTSVWQETYNNQVNYLPLSGGTVTGYTQFNNNITIFGNISATGDSYFANTFYTTTSALSVINIGNTGPAIYVGNNGTGDIASFYDLDQNIEVLHVGGNNGNFPNVGVKTSTPNETFTVKGTISASDTIYSDNTNSTLWGNAYTTLQASSANWQTTFNASSSYVASNPAGITGATALTNILQITQAGYNALTTPSPNTLYIIVG